MSEKKKPVVRFAGFTSDWEQRKLGEIATFINGRAYSQDELLDSGKYKVLRVGNFYTNDAWYYSDLELGEKYYADYGDLLYTWSATFGPHIWLGDRVIYHYHIWKVELSDALDKQFMVQLLEQDKANIISTHNGSTMVHVTKSDMEQKMISIPSVPEQKKIGGYLTVLDSLITIHQRKCDKLKNVKKSMLEKMFPKNGCRVPEIRFVGFTDDWEQRKLGEVANFSKGQGYTKSDLKDSGTPIILYGRLYTKYQSIIREVNTFSDVIDGAVLSKGGEVILPSSGETAEDIAIASSIEKSGFLLGGGLNIVLPNKEIKSSFLAIELSFGSPHTELAKRAQGKSIVHLYNEDLKKVVIPYPSIEEQTKISIMFEHLDNLITLHQRKLEKLQNIKKSCLEKMFV